jgi:hypothetical protein
MPLAGILHGGYHQNRDVCRAFITLKCIEDLEAVHHRRHQVQDDHVR